MPDPSSANPSSRGSEERVQFLDPEVVSPSAKRLVGSCVPFWIFGIIKNLECLAQSIWVTDVHGPNVFTAENLIGECRSEPFVHSFRAIARAQQRWLDADNLSGYELPIVRCHREEIITAEQLGCVRVANA